MLLWGKAGFRCRPGELPGLDWAAMLAGCFADALATAGVSAL